MNTPDNTPHSQGSIVYHQYDQNMRPTRTSGLAVTSMIMGILSILGGAVFILPPLFAVIFGHIAIGSCKRNPMIDGKGMAIAGVVMGWICIATWIIFILFFAGIIGLGIAGEAATSTP